MMRKGRISLAAKSNILIVTLVLVTSALMCFISERAFRRAVFEPRIQKLEQAEESLEKLMPYFSHFRQFLGTEELNAVRAQCKGDNTPLKEWMEKQPSMKEGSETDTLADDFTRYIVLTETCRINGDYDMILSEIEKDGKTYSVHMNDRYFFVLAYMLPDEQYTDFGEASVFPEPEKYAAPGTYETETDGEKNRYSIRCVQADLGGGDRVNLWAVINMTQELQDYDRFIFTSILLILGLTVVSSIVSMLLMRRFVIRPIRSLARATKDFKPEEDGTYSRERVSRADVRNRDEIGELSRDIRAMQENIVENTAQANIF